MTVPWEYPPIARRKKPRRRAEAAAPTFDYTDAEGNVLTLRGELSAATIASSASPRARAAASAEDAWHRRTEMLFERLAVSWVIAGLPLDDQKMLLGRYRMADADTQALGAADDRRAPRAPHPRARRMNGGASLGRRGSPSVGS